MLHKYWKLGASLCVTIVVWAGFYVFTAFTDNGYPDLVLKDVSGEAQGMSIEGYYNAGEGVVSEHVQITTAGSVYASDQSYFTRLKANYEPMIQNLMDKHRNFMRGKGYAPEAFFENDNYLVYGNVLNKRTDLMGKYQFNIAILNKKDEKKTAFHLDVPGQTDISYMDVLDVQVVHDELQLAASVDDAMGAKEIHVYYFDMETQGLTKDQTIVKQPKLSEKQSFDVTDIIEADEKAAHPYLIMVKTVTEMTAAPGDELEGMEEIVSRKWVVYDYKNGKAEPLSPPKEFLQKNKDQRENTELWQDKQQLYFITPIEKGLNVIAYDLETKKVRNVYQVELPKSMDGYPPFYIIQNNKLYSLINKKDQHTAGAVIAADLQTGKILYQGDIMKKDAKKQLKDADVDLYKLVVQ